MYHMISTLKKKFVCIRAHMGKLPKEILTSFHRELKLGIGKDFNFLLYTIQT